jgi:hypothetical protein
MALALGKNRHEYVGAGHLFAAGRLDMDHRTLDHPMESGRRLGILVMSRDEVGEFAVDVGRQIAAQDVEVDTASLHHRRRVLVVEKRQQQMLQRRKFLLPVVCERQGRVQRLLKALRKCRQASPQFFSITHCSGCWCWRAKSMTWVTLVSATS